MTRCDHGHYSSPCRAPSAPGFNPLGLCAEHLRIYRAHLARHPLGARSQSELGSFELSPIGPELPRARRP